MAGTKRAGGWKWLVVLLVLGGAGAGGYLYWKRPGEAEVEFKTAALARADLTQAVTANGQITPVKNVAVGSQVSGIIKEIKADFNSRVQEGDIIARIDSATYEQGVSQAEAELMSAKAGLELAQVTSRRNEELRKKELIAPAEADKSLADLHQAEATVKIREAMVNKAKLDLERTTIYAPISGIVISRAVDVGQTVAASFNTPTLFQIANDLAKMEIDAMVSEADVGGVEEGQKVTFTVDAFPGRQFQGQVRQVRFAPTTNQNVVTYTTVVDVNNSDLKLRPGMTANASILVSERKGVLRIPNTALRFRPPPGAVVQGATNAPAGEKPKMELATSGPFAGLPIPPWQSGGERRRPSEDERVAYESSLTPEQKQKYQQVMTEMRARFAQGGGGGPGGGGGGSGGSGGGPGGGGERPRRSEPDRPRSQTVYLLEKEASPNGPEKTVLKPVTVKLGVSDGTHSEVTEGLKEGDVVVVGTTSSAASTSTAAAPSPFGNPFGGPGRR